MLDEMVGMIVELEFMQTGRALKMRKWHITAGRISLIELAL